MSKVSIDLKDKRIKELFEKGKKNGSLTYKEVMDFLEDVDLSPEQIESMYEVFEDNGIEVTEEQDQEDEDKDKLDIDVPEGINIDDPVRMYLKEIGRFIINGRRKADLAMRMEAGDEAASENPS